MGVKVSGKVTGQCALNSFSRDMPRKVRELIQELERAGFVLVPGAKGSHRKFRHPRFAGSVILSGQASDDAYHYQEKQVRHALRKAQS
jgi:predicted RNA binding protein YcfA (HicA-like mRNA interferase family)